MKRPQSMFALLLTAALIFSLTACGQPAASSQTEPAEKNTTASTAVQQPAETTVPSVPTQPTKPAPTVPQKAEPAAYDRSLDMLRERLEPSGAIIGVMYLGIHEGEPMDDDFYAMLEEQGLLKQYPFLTQIPRSNFARNDGMEIYLVIPADPAATVTVTEWDMSIGAGNAGAVLYEGQNGDPFFVQGNASDIMQNLAISVTNSFGFTLQNYHPYMSLRDGRLACETESGDPMVMDLTRYEESGIYFEVFFPNETFDGMESVPMHMEQPDENLLMELLAEQRALPDTVQMNSFRREGRELYLDLNAAFAAYLSSLDANGETLVLGCVVNSFLSCFDADVIRISVDGGVLQTAHGEYPGTLEFYPLS